MSFIDIHYCFIINFYFTNFISLIRRFFEKQSEGSETRQVIPHTTSEGPETRQAIPHTASAKQ